MKIIKIVKRLDKDELGNKKVKPFYVKEKNPYFNWYKNNRYYKVLKEWEMKK